jgi:hypothetical protein
LATIISSRTMSKLESLNTTILIGGWCVFMVRVSPSLGQAAVAGQRHDVQIDIEPARLGRRAPRPKRSFRSLKRWNPGRPGSADVDAMVTHRSPGGRRVAPC